MCVAFLGFWMSYSDKLTPMLIQKTIFRTIGPSFSSPQYKPVQLFQPKPDSNTKNKQHQPADLLNKKKHPKPQPPFTSLCLMALLPLLKALTAHAHALGACVKGVAVLLLSAFKAIPKARRSVRTRRCKANKASNSKEAKRTCGRWCMSVSIRINDSWSWNKAIVERMQQTSSNYLVWGKGSETFLERVGDRKVCKQKYIVVRLLKKMRYKKNLN